MTKKQCKKCGRIQKVEDLVEVEHRIMMSNEKRIVLMCEDCATKDFENRRGILGGML
jgi:RNase P subunit RPR2